MIQLENEDEDTCNALDEPIGTNDEKQAAIGEGEEVHEGVLGNEEEES